MGVASDNFLENCTTIEARIEQKQVALFEMSDQPFDELVFRGAYSVVDKT